MMTKRFFYILTAVFVLCLSVNCFAAEGEFDAIYSENFESGSVPSNAETGDNISVNVKNGELLLESASVFGFAVNDDGTMDFSGFSMPNFENAKIRELSEPKEYNGIEYYYSYGSNEGYLTGEIDGKKAQQILTFHNGSETSDPRRTNVLKLVPDDSFINSISGISDVTFDVELYANEEYGSNNMIYFAYTDTSGTTKYTYISQADMLAAKEANGGDPWVTVSKSLTDVDLTKPLNGKTTYFGKQQYNIEISGGYQLPYSNYIRSFSIGEKHPVSRFFKRQCHGICAEISGNQNALSGFFIGAVVSKHMVNIFINSGKRSVSEGFHVFRCFAECDQFFVKRENGI